MKKREGGKRRRGDAERKPKSSISPIRSTQSSAELSTIPSPRLRVSASPRPALHPSSFILHPSKRLGQNFLISRGVVDRIVNFLGPRKDETIIEIGPGKGALTQRLVEEAGFVVAVEFDRNLGPALVEKFASRNNFTLVQADALTTEFCEAIQPATKARVVANLPYNISTAILQRLIEQRCCLTEMVLMLQREVVDRITASAGSTERGYLSVVVQAYCETEKLLDVAPGAFRPVPKVWSSVVRLRVRPETELPVDEQLFLDLVSAGFAQRRKTILNNLRNAPERLRELIKPRGGVSIILCEANIQPQRRAETLTIAEWFSLARLFA
ncbi:MAG: 16S rRNA (adenine(1518)-N(6)/adenine(1519)-N(6))-dimethyltransferase RsmA [Acidobacteriota bacterium]|nr:16S rRNA (adenine(1518)-N(6)/adenine(1519)-N(6))-dimethyltransferase RsmA [Acidobacteriota bacterium]